MLVYGAPMDNMSFSFDGCYLFGTSNNAKVRVSLVKCVPALLAGRRQLLLCSGENQNLVQHHQPQAAQGTNNPTITQNIDGMSTISVLQQMEAEGAVVLRSLCENGTTKVETLTRLPECLRSTSSPTILNPAPGKDSKTVRLVLNKAPQNEYILADIEGNGLPAILERLKTTIPAVIGKRGRLWRNGRDEWEEHGRMLLRNGEDGWDEYSEPRRKRLR
jgi:hypothetical protein